jgi:hypothetical protein
MAEQEDIQANRRVALTAASTMFNITLDEALRRPEEIGGAVVRLAELIEAGYFATGPVTV